jgi:outer membrane protein OmpA-like peptidoglycan-associated protein
MKKTLLAGVFFAFVPMAAFAQVTIQDVTFVAGHTHVDVAQVRQSQTAITTAANPAVRNFAQDEVKYHTDQGQVLASMLPPVPSTTTPCMTWQSVLVQRVSAPDFDAAYLQAAIYNHQRLIAVLEGEIKAGSDPNLKAYAQKELPIIQAQLAEAQALLAGGTARALPAPLTVRPTFRSGEWSLTGADQGSLNDFAHSMAGMQQVTVTATGHTDTVPIGPELKRMGVPTNQVLSERRAESVKQYLVNQRLPAEEIQTAGRGPNEPVASNATEAGRAQNRRVEVKVANATGRAMSGLGVTGPVAGIPSCWD